MACFFLQAGGNEKERCLMRREIPRLCRGGSWSLTSSGATVRSPDKRPLTRPAPAGESARRGPPSPLGEGKPDFQHAAARDDFFPLPWGEGGRGTRSGEGSFSGRWRTGPFEGPATVKPPALP